MPRTVEGTYRGGRIQLAEAPADIPEESRVLFAIHRRDRAGPHWDSRRLHFGYGTEKCPRISMNGWAHNPEVAGSNPAPATKKMTREPSFSAPVLYCSLRRRVPDGQGLAFSPTACPARASTTVRTLSERPSAVIRPRGAIRPAGNAVEGTF